MNTANINDNTTTLINFRRLVDLAEAVWCALRACHAAGTLRMAFTVSEIMSTYLLVVEQPTKA